MSEQVKEVSGYAKMLAVRGGIANCGGHLGVFVSPRENAQRCPPGWTFVELETATPEIVQEAIDNCKNGRAGWPDQENMAGTKVRRVG